MLYDLNLAWSPDTSAAQLRRTLKFASSLGYDVVGLNHTVSAPIPSHVANPIPLLTPPPPSHPSAAPPSSSHPSSGAATTTPTTSTTTPPTAPATVADPSTASPSSAALPTTLRRATVVISDPATNHRLSAFAAAYDVVAVRPTTERAFAACCTTMAEFSLISLDLTSFFPFHFHPRTSMAAVARGVHFEICYAQALAAPDPRSRANFVANLASLVRATKGRGLVVSSGSTTASAATLRAPADVVNLLAVWGLSADRGKAAQAANPRAVVVNEGIKRRGFRGVVDVLQGTGGPDPTPTPTPTPAGEGGPGDKKSKRGAKRKERQKQQKHKAGGDEGRDGEETAGDRSQTLQQQGKKRPGEEGGADTEGSSPASKRQAKKMRLATQKKTPPG